MITPPSIPLLVVPWFLSILPFVAARGGVEVEGASRFGLALLPWLAFAGLPRGPKSAVGSWSWVPLVGLALPPLALGLVLDHHAGIARPLEGALGVVLVAGLARAADRAAGKRAMRRLHAGLWLFLLPGTAALGVALGWLGAPGAEAPWWPVAQALHFNPLAFGHTLAAAEGAELNRLSVFLGVLLLYGLPRLVGREGEGSR